MAIINQVLHRMNSSGTYDEIYLKANMANVTGILAVTNGGTGANDATAARTNLGAAASSHTHTKSNITDFPTSMPASDVYAWAKASSKPSYTYSEVGAAASSHSHSAASANAAGFMSAADKTKLNGIATGANAYTHPSAKQCSYAYSHPSTKQCNAVGVQSWDASTGTLYLN